MKKFIYFLNESPGYPNEIYANDKAEVQKLICETCEASSIEAILTEEEFLAKQGIKMNAKNNSADDAASSIDSAEIEEADYANGNDFMNDMMNKAFRKASTNQIQREQEELAKKTTAESSAPQPAPVVQQEAKYFEDHGIKFKVEGGKIFKKVWVDISSGDGAEYRIIRKSTGKVVSGDGLILEKLDWQELA